MSARKGNKDMRQRGNGTAVRILRWKAGIYEILVPDRERKIYFDVDKAETPLSEIKRVILDIGQRRVLAHHPYAQNLEAMGPVVRFVQQYKELEFDTGVYMKNRNFKCINQAKPNQPRQAYIEGDAEWSKHLVMHDFDDHAVDIGTLSFPMLPELATKRRDGSPATNPTDFDWLTAEPLDKLAILPCAKRAEDGFLRHDVIWRVMLWCRDIGIDFEDFWAWVQQKDSSVTYFKKQQEAWRGSVQFFPNIRETKVTLRLRDQFELSEERITEGVHGGFYDFRDISPPMSAPTDPKGVRRFFPQGKGTRPSVKFSVLTRPMGSGKTEAVVAFIKRYGVGKRVLWLAPRITLSANTEQRLEKQESAPLSAETLLYPSSNASSISKCITNQADLSIQNLRKFQQMSPGCLDPKPPPQQLSKLAY
ncbi:uncharacterized protein EV422DRAFT_579027 [Fimicolochytrium jonesii]|uniref:uncharacterized protein n=1 Tax=Fimicolochytrium jonesii TaxID=1396493 RepID=UPI0022FE4DC1|nr:uncharacterized protein EV422DRAFT_579027 [Fimicolochytrium jonesii]KAI8820284.1 hypothetical protein EV422DRAFT_579027 [Fimicolochytrium jonesii]